MEGEEEIDDDVLEVVPLQRVGWVRVVIASLAAVVSISEVAWVPYRLSFQVPAALWWECSLEVFLLLQLAWSGLIVVPAEMPSPAFSSRARIRFGKRWLHISPEVMQGSLSRWALDMVVRAPIHLLATFLLLLGFPGVTLFTKAWYVRSISLMRAPVALAPVMHDVTELGKRLVFAVMGPKPDRAFLSMMGLIIFALLQVHYVGCFYFWIVRAEEFPVRTWAIMVKCPSGEGDCNYFQENLHDAPLCYLRSLYWALGALSSGAVDPETRMEVGFSVLVVVIGLSTGLLTMGNFMFIASRHPPVDERSQPAETLHTPVRPSVPPPRRTAAVASPPCQPSVVRVGRDWIDDERDSDSGVGEGLATDSLPALTPNEPGRAAPVRPHRRVETHTEGSDEMLE